MVILEHKMLSSTKDKKFTVLTQLPLPFSQRTLNIVIPQNTTACSKENLQDLLGDRATRGQRMIAMLAVHGTLGGPALSHMANALGLG